MNTVEDRMREAFAQVSVPDLPVPEIQAVQRRARRHRLNQASGALGSAAVVVMCVLGGMSFGHHSSGAIDASGTKRVPAHISGVAAPQWLITTKDLGGRRLETASFREGGKACTISSLGGGWCQAAGWPDGEVADAGLNGDGTAGTWQVVEVSGRVPADARTVRVDINDESTTVEAVATPTSRSERFFAAYLRVPAAHDVPLSPILAVFDESGHPVAAPHPHDDVVTGTEVSHVAGLPGNQVSFSTTESGVSAIVYRAGSTPCVALAMNGVLRAHTCAATAPDAGRPLLAVKVPGYGRMVLGDAPAWADQLQVSGPDSYGRVTLSRVGGVEDRSFWLSQAPAAGSHDVIATCATGDNCIVVKKWLLPTAS